MKFSLFKMAQCTHAQAALGLTQHEMELLRKYAKCASIRSSIEFPVPDRSDVYDT